jgi:hypothetical protein
MLPSEGLPVPDDCHPKIRELVDYWKAVRPAGGLPGRRHLDPAALPHLLPNIWLIDVAREPLRFRMRLLGSRITDYAGEDNTGVWFDERWPDFDPLALVKVVKLGEPSWWRGQSLLRPEKNYYELERVRLPLAADGKTVDMILSLTVFFDKDGKEIL